MPRKNAALPLVALAALGFATACEKPSPIVTVTADGVVVTAHATKYCRDNGKCNESQDTPSIDVTPGSFLGIDVPRSVAEHGWRISPQEEYRHDHYRKVPLDGIQPGQELRLQVQRDPKHGEGTWEFHILVKER